MMQSEEMRFAKVTLPKSEYCRRANQNGHNFETTETTNISYFLHAKSGYRMLKMKVLFTTPVHTRGLIPQTGVLFIRHLKHLSDRLTKCRPRGSMQPKLGQICLIMKGKTGCDKG
jgi:hypothetical protein